MVAVSHVDDESAAQREGAQSGTSIILAARARNVILNEPRSRNWQRMGVSKALMLRVNALDAMLERKDPGMESQPHVRNRYARARANTSV